MFLATKFALGFILPITTYQLTQKYQNNNDLYKLLQNSTIKHPTLASIYHIGKSNQNHALFVVKITGADKYNDLLKPNVKFIGNIHGHSTGGRQLLLNLVEYLLENYGKDENVTRLIDTTKIHVLCSMNPDGFEKRLSIVRILSSNSNTQDIDTLRWNDDIGHVNSRGVDLNLDFDWESGRSYKNQPETNAIIKWLDENPFVLSASFFSKELVVSYPFSMSNNGHETPTPDDELFKKISKTYSYAHDNMTRNKSSKCDDDTRYYKDGIVNGAVLKESPGTMGDYNYHRKSCLEIAVYLGCERWIAVNNLQRLWQENKNALLAFIGQAHIGVKGIIQTNNSIPIANVQVRTSGADVFSWKNGAYWKLLMPGMYVMEISAPEYYTKTIRFNVTEGVTVLNITLLRNPSSDAIVDQRLSTSLVIFVTVLIFTLRYYDL